MGYYRRADDDGDYESCYDIYAIISASGGWLAAQFSPASRINLEESP